MKRYQADGGIPTLEIALNEVMNSDDLKKLVALTEEKPPTRKADLVAVIVRHLEGERRGGLARPGRATAGGSGGGRPFELDPVPRRSVPRQVRAISGLGNDRQVRAPPPPLGAGFFFYGNGVMPTDIKERLKAFVPQPVEAKIETLAELPAAYGLPYSAGIRRQRPRRRAPST